MNLKKIYEISGEIKIDNNLTEPIIQERLQNLFRKNMRRNIITTDKGVEFQYGLSWWKLWDSGGLIYDICSNTLGSETAFGHIKIDVPKKTINYKISLFPVLATYISLTIILLVEITDRIMGYAILEAVLILFLWATYVAFYLTKSSQLRRLSNLLDK